MNLAEADLKVLNQQLASAGLDVVTRIFPRKIMSAELQQLIDDVSIPGSPWHSSGLLNGSIRPEKKRKIDADTSLAKSQLEESSWTTLARHRHLVGSKPTELKAAYSIIKDESNAMVQLTDQALTWLLVSYCKGKDASSKSDQDTLGVREELLCELHRAQEAGINMHASIFKASHYRADLRSKIADHPEIEDYVLTLHDYDEHQVLLLYQNIRDLRNIYIVLHDLVQLVVA